jgi:hypothetical protein
MTPLYLVLHLMTSPVAQPTSDADTITADPADIALIPVANILGFWVPFTTMALPSPSVVASMTHYYWDAIWQPFPATQNLLVRILRPVAASSRGSYPEAAGAVYRYIIALCVASQLALLAVALTPATAVPPTWAAVFHETTLETAFVPYWPWAAPALNTALPIVADGRAEIARLFFQWDIYCGGAALLAWSLYLFGVSRLEVGTLTMVPKVVFWTALGGPTAAAAVVLWERDAVLLEKRGKDA